MIELCQFHKQIKSLQQQNHNIKKVHKEEIKNISKDLTNNIEEFFHLRNHNKNLLVKFKKLKIEKKTQHNIWKKKLI
jgi:hypothetical protein